MTHKKILRFDISVNEMLRMYKLKYLHHLAKEHQNGFQAERPITEIELLFQVLTKLFHYHDIVITLLEDMIDFWDCSFHFLILIQIG